MMSEKKWCGKDIWTLTKTVIFLLMGMQIVFGLCFAACNLFVIPRFAETGELEEISRTFRFDAYSGVCYPVLIRMAGWIERIFSVKYCVVLYLVQIIVSIVVYMDFEKKVFRRENRKRNLFFALYVTTIPTVLQCHMSVLAYSLTASVFVWMLSNVICLLREKEICPKRLICICAGWIMSAALLPDYAWIGALVLVLGSVCYTIHHRKAAIRLVIAVVFSTLSIGVFQNMFLVENPEKIQPTAGAAMLTRFVWPDFSTYSFFWNAEVKEQWGSGMEGLTYGPEKVIYEFGPVMEQNYGKEFSDETYWDMTKISLRLGTRKIVEEIGTEITAYLCPPMAMFFQLRGEGCSYTGWNYGRMIEHTPRLAKVYVSFSLKSWFVVAGVAFVVWLSGIKKQVITKKEKNVSKWETAFFVMTAFIINLWYVMSKGHMSDYKYVIVISVLWGLGLVKILFPHGKCEE